MSGDSQTSVEARVLLPFAVLALAWGGSFVGIEVAVEHAPPLLLAGLRYGVAAAVVVPYAVWTESRLLPRSRDDLGAAAAAAAFTIAGYQAFLFVGTQYVPGSVASVVVSTSPVVTAVLAGVLLEESTDLADAAGFVLGLIGVVLVAQPDPGSLGGTTLGVGLVFVGSVSFAVGAVGTRSFDPQLPTVAVQAWAMVGGSAALLIGSRLRGETVPAPSAVPAEAVIAFAYVALVAGALGYLLYFRLLATAGATETTLVSYFEPVVAAGVAAAFLGQPITAPTVGGFLAVVGGFAVIERGRLVRVVDRRLAITVSGATDH
jgi:drug/metabolite transporter (DMT)-like permease